MILSLMSLALAQSFPVQGTVHDAGAPASGTLPVTFRLYPAESTPLAEAAWYEDDTVVFVDGAFQSWLGDTTAVPPSLLQATLWLGISVNGGPESARVPVGWAPRAAWAQDAGKVGGQTLSQLDARYLRLDPAAPQAGDLAISGDVTAAEVILNGSALSTLLATYLPKAGGTLTGPLSLAGDPTAAAHATPRSWVESAIATAAAARLPLSGGTLTGALTLAGAPTLGNHATTKTYVDAAVASATPGAPVCNSATAGVVRWASGALQACDGTNWITAINPANGSSSTTAARSCYEIKTAFPSSVSGAYWLSPPGFPAFQAWCDMTNHGGGWTLVLAAGLNVDLTAGNLTGDTSTLPTSTAQPASGVLLKMSDARINALRTTIGSSIGYWVTTPGSGTGTLGAEIFHRADCTFQMHQLSSAVKATTCHQSTINFHATNPTWVNGGHWWDNNASYKWAFGYANEGDRGTGTTCHNNGTGLGAHSGVYAPFHRGWCASQAWGQVWVR